MEVVPVRARRWRRYQTALALAFLLTAGCGAGSPVAPVPAASTPSVPVASPAPLWGLRTTVTSVTGPSCFSALQVGRSVDWVLDVRRSGTEVRLLYDVRNFPTDHIELVGVQDGDAFTASTSFRGAQPCTGTYVFDSRVAGQFSADGNTITATETWTYRLDSGDAIVVAFDWSATRLRASTSQAISAAAF
jgi:hypothetical protein